MIRNKLFSILASTLGSAVMAASLWLLTAGATASAQETIKVGEINSYTRLSAFTEPYRKGWQLAVEEINNAGGVIGRPLEVISRDDDGDPGTALRIAEELVLSEEVDLLAGTFLSNIGLAVSELANRRQVFFLAAEPLSDAIVWDKGNRYTFRLRPSTHMQAAMLADAAAELGAKRWATVAPNYKYGQDAVATFKAQLKARQPDVEFVAEQWPPLFDIDAGSTVAALENADPDAIYNVTFGADVAKFAREGTLRGLFEDRPVVSLLTGEPEYLEPLGEETPEGWIVTGYPWYAIDDPSHERFLNAYQEKFDESPKMGSVVGYNTFKSIAAIIEEAGSVDTDAMIEAAEGLTVEGLPLGPVTYRAIDHQSTMGAYVGRLALEDGKGVMTDIEFKHGADFLPPDEEVKKMRPQ